MPPGLHGGAPKPAAPPGAASAGVPPEHGHDGAPGGKPPEHDIVDGVTALVGGQDVPAPAWADPAMWDQLKQSVNALCQHAGGGEPKGMIPPDM